MYSCVWILMLFIVWFEWNVKPSGVMLGIDVRELRSLYFYIYTLVNLWSIPI